MKIIGKILKITCALLLSYGFFATPGQAGDGLKNYTLGEGIRVANLHISGYLTINNEMPRTGKSNLVIDDLSLYVKGRFNKWLNPFVEAEIVEAPLYVQGSGLFSGRDPQAVVERLYNDSQLTGNLTLRLGKSLDPIGEWNRIHAGPLVPTSTRPLTSFRSFSEFISGISLIYRPGNEALPSLMVYWQPAGNLFRNKDKVANREFRDIKGLYLSWNWGFDNLFGIAFQTAGVNYAGHKLNEHQYLLGLNLHLVRGAFQFQAEFTKVWLKDPLFSRARTTETGIYLQGLYDLTEKWAIFTRYEYFEDRNFLNGSHNALAGVKFNPNGPVVWKLEYVNQWGQWLGINTGVVASLSVLF